MPIIAARIAPGIHLKNSATLNPKPRTFLTGTVFTPAPIVSALTRISATAKIPINVVRVLKPPRISGIPKVKRAVPSIGASPTSANTRPSIPARSPLTMFPAERIATIVRAKKQIPKLSGKENFSATSASHGAKNVRITNEKIDPKNENTIPTPRARIASPF